MPMSRRKRRRAKPMDGKRSIIIAGHRTSVSVEDAFWKGLNESAGVRRMTLSKLVASIDAERRGNLSSAIRLFVLDFYRQQNSPAVLISSNATAAERNMRRIARGQTVETLFAYLLGYRGRIVSYRQLGRFLGYTKMGRRELHTLATHISYVKRLLARRKAPFAIAVAVNVGYAICSILPDSK
jgi:predicted DNA-binding ribbon-helix-helix protein